jgi:4-hydroxy 2-oxovalerate aldolase
MMAEQVVRIITTLRREFPGEVGIHTHDNMQRALANSIAATNAGAMWLDGTVTGMGRGAGNVKTEYLLLELNRLGVAKYNVLTFLDLVNRHFGPLQRQYGWGPNLYYYLSGDYHVHPTYVQQMLADSRYSSDDIVATLAFLRDREGYSFRPEELVQAQQSAVLPTVGTWSAAGWADGQDVLLVAAGEHAFKHREALTRFIRKLQLKVIALNLHAPVEQADIAAWAACHPERILMDIGRYAELARPLIAPMSALPEMVVARLPPEQRLDYGLEVYPETFVFGEYKCTIPRPLVAAYTLALATSAGARRIFLAGFDGFGAGDARQHEMADILSLYQSMPGACPLLAVTPSTYPVPQSSVYAPLQ